jgi:hypothetical protein
VYAGWPAYLRTCFPIPRLQDLEIYENKPFTLDDIIHFIRHCVKPFGIVRGSEKQGGQHEMGLSAVTWTAPTIATLVIDGKEANVVNIWHYHDLHAGEDLVLRLKLMPVKTFTLNHYFKGFSRKTYEVDHTCLAWQLVPDVFNLELDPEEQTIPRISYERATGHVVDLATAQERAQSIFNRMCSGKYLSRVERDKRATCLYTLTEPRVRDQKSHRISNELTLRRNFAFNLDSWSSENAPVSWQQLGYWHIGRTQVARPKYGTCEFYNDDMANSLKTNHIDLTFQPHFGCLPRIPVFSGFAGMASHPVAFTKVSKPIVSDEQRQWTPQLGLETFIRPKAGSTGKRLSFEGAPRVAGRGQRAAHPEAPPAKRATFRAPAAPQPSRVRMSDWNATLARCRAQLAAYRDSQAPETVAESGEPVHAPAESESLLGSSLQAPETVGPSTDAAPDDATPMPLAEPGISESSRQELLEGLAAPAAKKTGRVGARARKSGEGAASRGPVDGTLLRPGAEPEACRMELL